MLATEKPMNTGWFESAKRAGTKGGEALPGAVTGERWYVLWTHSNSEQLVHNQLAAKGFQLFLPNIDAWHRRGGVRALARVPLFPGYLFVRGNPNKGLLVLSVDLLHRSVAVQIDCTLVEAA